MWHCGLLGKCQSKGSWSHCSWQSQNFRPRPFRCLKEPFQGSYWGRNRFTHHLGANRGQLVMPSRGTEWEALKELTPNLGNSGLLGGLWAERKSWEEFDLPRGPHQHCILFFYWRNLVVIYIIWLISLYSNVSVLHMHPFFFIYILKYFFHYDLPRILHESCVRSRTLLFIHNGNGMQIPT